MTTAACRRVANALSNPGFNPPLLPIGPYWSTMVATPVATPSWLKW